MDSSSDYILDANVIMSLLISGKSSSLSLLRLHNYYTPDFVFDEIGEHSKTILAKAKLNQEALRHYVTSIMREIAVVPRFLIQESDLEQAEFYCKNIDENDVAYVVLSLSTGFPLITRDKPLFTGLRKKRFRQVALFEDFLQTI